MHHFLELFGKVKGPGMGANKTLYRNDYTPLFAGINHALEGFSFKKQVVCYNIHMNEIALYRKYRPQSFKDVLGQEHIVKVLEGSISLGNISHAYLFAGSRGTGKTSLARIFAKAIGCSDNDLYEIDAASNRGIDDIREASRGGKLVAV